MFQRLSSKQTGITFSNNLEPTEELNTYTYRNFYNGGGVAIGDISGDGLPDLYFTGNQVSNRLYLNKGDFTFEDITDKAGVSSSDVWSTGVSMADVNGDGLLDIYVCKSGPPGGKNRANELFINNGDLTFTEKAAEYGIDVEGLSVHASFLDSDLDGDLDMYLVSNPIRSFNNAEMINGDARTTKDNSGGNRLFRNELVSDETSINGKHFTDVTEQAGIYSSQIGFGLGVSVGDVNGDGWPDMYISNDFFERDYLYLNNQDGTFDEKLEEQMNAISLSSMGGDIADLDHDGYPEIFISDMLGGNEKRLKSNTKFNTWKQYQELVNKNYHHQFTRNTLQWNNGDGSFSEAGRLAGVAASDWSWGALAADFDLNGHRDIFVANGIYKNLLDQDFLSSMSDPRAVRNVLNKPEGILRLISLIPSRPLGNVVFAGRGGLVFADSAAVWGLGEPGFSNGSSYGDLDGDGDLELVVNNVNGEAWLYRNRAVEQGRGGWLQVALAGAPGNPRGVGAALTVWSGGRAWYGQQQPVRGFQSTVDGVLQVGLGAVERVDSLQLVWPDGRVSRRGATAPGQRLRLSWQQAGEVPTEDRTEKNYTPTLLERVGADSLGLGWRHRESSYNDFARQPLLQHMRSAEGPAACMAGGGDMLYLGGAKGQPGAVFVAGPSGRWQEATPPVMAGDRASEDTDCTWLDANGDARPDLYVASGSSELPGSSSALADRLYLSEGTGGWAKASPQALPTGLRYRPTGAVAGADVNGDGHSDLFVGERLTPFAWGVPAAGHLLVGDGAGSFRSEPVEGLAELGMITDAVWGDHDGDGDPDLWVVGEWMAVTIFENKDGRLQAPRRLEGTVGWWQSLVLADLDADGDLDWVGGNHGWNSRYQASPGRPVELWVGDFDGNGRLEQLLARSEANSAYPVALRHHLLEALPGWAGRYPSYASYAGQSIEQLLTPDQRAGALHYKASMLGSVVGWNEGGRFRVEELPARAQLAPTYGILATDLDGDGRAELILGGNQNRVAPQSGPYRASYGVVLTRRPGGPWQALPPQASGLSVTGEIRKILAISGTERNKRLLFVRNNTTPIIYEKRK